MPLLDVIVVFLTCIILAVLAWHQSSRLLEHHIVIRKLHPSPNPQIGILPGIPAELLFLEIDTRKSLFGQEYN